MAALQQNNLIRFEVHGSAQGQRVDNGWWYEVNVADGVFTLSQLLDGIRSNWRLQFLPLLHIQYSVLTYTMKTLGSVIQRTAPGGGFFSPSRLALRYRDQEILGGTVDDVGEAAGDALPTFVSVGTRKVVSQLRTIRGEPIVAGFKLPKGGARFSPLPLSILTPGTSNVLVPADVADWNTALASIRVLDTAPPAVVATMVVLSLSHDGGIPWAFGAPPVVEAVKAQVSSIAINPLATSQVSRKATLAGLG